MPNTTRPDDELLSISDAANLERPQRSDLPLVSGQRYWAEELEVRTLRPVLAFRRSRMDGRTGGGDRQRWCAVNELAHILAPSEATWVGEWRFEGSCGHQYWIRYFRGRSWTVETSGPEPIDIDHAGCQLEDGSVERWILLDGALDLNAGQALMLAETLSRAAEELERIEGGGG